MSGLLRMVAHLWHALAVGLQPVLSVVVGLPGRLHPFVGLAVLSVILGAVMVLVFRLVSNQPALRRLREQLKGHLLGALVFNHSFRAVLRHLGRALGVNLRYLGRASVPLLIMALPVIILYVQLQRWYAWRPPVTGETCLLLVRYRGQVPDPGSVKLFAPEERWQVAEGYVFPSARALVWELTPRSPSNGHLLVEVEGRRMAKALVAGETRPGPLSPVRSDGRDFLTAFAHPGEALLPGEAGVESIHFAYPSRREPGMPWYTHWVAWFFGLTVLAGLLWSRVFGVTL
jgi:hypothetical protein